MIGVPRARVELPSIKTGTNQPRFTAGTASEPGSDLGLVVTMVSTVVMVMVDRGKHRSCKHQQKQGGNKNLLHATNLARGGITRKWPNRHDSRQERDRMRSR